MNVMGRDDEGEYVVVFLDGRSAFRYAVRGSGGFLGKTQPGPIVSGVDERYAFVWDDLARAAQCADAWNGAEPVCACGVPLSWPDERHAVEHAEEVASSSMGLLDQDEGIWTDARDNR